MLDGLRVLDVSSMVAGPYASMLLADWGAEVTKVEPISGDAARHLGPAFPSGHSALFASVNRGKRSLAIDLRKPDARPVLDAALRSSDVLIHNMLPKLAKRAGLVSERLEELNPDLVTVEINGFGRGADSDRPGLDTVFQAMSGLMSMTGEPDGRPLRAGAPIVDVAAGITAAFASVMGILQRHRAAKGAHFSISMLHVAMALQTPNVGASLAEGKQPPRLGAGSPFAFTDSYATADGHIALSIVSDRMWRSLTDLIGEDRLRAEEFATNEGRIAGRSEIAKVLEGQFSEKSTHVWEHDLGRANIPHGPVHTYGEAVSYMEYQGEDPVIDHQYSAGQVSSLASPLSPRHASSSAVGPPGCGEHTVAVLAEWGFTLSDIESMRSSGTLRAG